MHRVHARTCGFRIVAGLNRKSTIFIISVSGQVLQQVRHNLRSVQDAVELRTIFR